MQYGFSFRESRIARPVPQSRHGNSDSLNKSESGLGNGLLWWFFNRISPFALGTTNGRFRVGSADRQCVSPHGFAGGAPAETVGGDSYKQKCGADIDAIAFQRCRVSMFLGWNKIFQAPLVLSFASSSKAHLYPVFGHSVRVIGSWDAQYKIEYPALALKNITEPDCRRGGSLPAYCSPRHINVRGSRLRF